MSGPSAAPSAKPLLFDLRSGELVGEGCFKDVAYLKARVRRVAAKRLVLDEEFKALEALLAEYGSEWWRWRNGQLVGSVCREACEEAMRRVFA